MSDDLKIGGKCMRNILRTLLGASSFAALIFTAHGAAAQTVPATGDTATEADTFSGGEDIVVTARRREETLQDVPSTVNVVSAQTIAKLNLQDFKDIQFLTPGLELSGGNDGYDATVSLRGVTVDPQSSATPVVQMYVNEVVVDPNILFQSMFDIGQIEVLRGPQGTLRGRSAPAGAITVGTRRADLTQFGGYLDATVDVRGQVNFNAAVNVPLITDVLALRIAGIMDHDQGDGIRSVNSNVGPRKLTEGIRASLAFKPDDNLSVHLMYQRMSARTRSFNQVAGTGAPGPGPGNPVSVGPIDLGCGTPLDLCFISAAAPPANYNGPAISFRDRLAVADTFGTSDQTIDLLTGNIDYRFAGQKLSYVGGWQRHAYENRGGGDSDNLFVGELPGSQITAKQEQTHELRLASEDRIAGIFDYTVGVFYSRFRSEVKGISPVLLGVFNPFATNGAGVVLPQFVNPANVANVVINLNPRNKEFSYFGSVTAHIGSRTELSGGIRHISTSTAFNGPYGVQGQGSSTCFDFPDAIFPDPQLADYCFANAANEQPIKNSAWVWSASLSHRVSDDLLAYVNAGSSFRPGPFSIVTLDLEPAGYTPATDLRFHVPETSRGVEIGFKASLFDKRLNFNVAAYYQKYSNHIFLTKPTYGYNVGGNRVDVIQYIANADATAKGFDIEASLRITPRWSLSGAFSWTKANFANDEIPCNDGNFDGTPDTIVPTAAGFSSRKIVVARCKSNGAVNTAPRWNLSLQSEYSHPLSGDADGFIRGLFTYQPENPNRSDGIVIEDYGLLNLYAGVRSPDGHWEAMVFAENLFDTTKLLSQGPQESANDYFGLSGYRSVSTTPRRTVGFKLRYAFGSR